MRTEAEFINDLEEKAGEQRRIMETEMLPDWAKGVGEWLVVNPWRLVIPVASMAYVVLRSWYGESVRELVLGLFGGFR